MMFVFIWLVFLVEMMVGDRRLLRWTSIEVAMLAIVLAYLITMLTQGKLLIRQFLNGYAIPYAMYAIGKNIFWKKKDIDRFIFLLAVPLSLYFPLTNIFEHYHINALVFPKYILRPNVTYDWGGRAMGTFIQPVATGFAMVAIYVLSMYSLSRIRSGFARIYAAVVTLVTPIGVFFAYTRSVYLGYAAAMIALTVFSKRLRVFGFVVIVMLALVVLGNWANATTTSRETGGLADKETVISRLVLMEASLRIFMDHPLRGVGVGRFLERAEPYVRQVRTTILGYRETWIAKHTNQHNQFLTVLVETGVLGGIPLILLYIFLLKTLSAARHIKMPAVDPDFTAAVLAVVAAYVANVAFIEPRYFEFMNALPFLLIGIIVGNYQRTVSSTSHNKGREGIA
jgi:O-antigen ligase